MDVLYTIMPPELYADRSGDKKNSFICRNGILLEGERTGDYFKIQRGTSSNPAVYLDPRLSPGRMIRL